MKSEKIGNLDSFFENKLESREIEINPDLVKKYSLFKERFNPKEDVVYHPCGAYDVSPSSAFPESRVIYVDIDEKAMEALSKEGYETHTASALEFSPGDVDILIMINPTILPDIPSSCVVENGFVLSNDYSGTATLLNEDEQYELQAVIRLNDNKESILDFQDLDDYWKEVETEEEFKNAPLNWGFASYRMAAEAVEAVTGKRENVLCEYKKIIEKLREEKREQNVEMLRSYPDLESYLEDPDKMFAFILNCNGRQYPISAKFPKKKGNIDDIFIFQKNIKKSKKINLQI